MVEGDKTTGEVSFDTLGDLTFDTTFFRINSDNDVQIEVGIE